MFVGGRTIWRTSELITWRTRLNSYVDFPSGLTNDQAGYVVVSRWERKPGLQKKDEARRGIRFGSSQPKVLPKSWPRDEHGPMNMATFSSKFHLPTERSAKNHWKVGLYVANFVYALFLIRYGSLFPDALIILSSIIVIGLFLYAGFMQLKHLGDGSGVMAYIKGHEGWMLLFLTILLISGTVSYMSWQTRLYARAIANSKLSSVSQLTETDAEQTGLHSSSPTPATLQFQPQLALPSPANTPVTQSSDTPAPAVQAVAKPQLQRRHTAKRNHLLGTHSHRPQHRHPHAQTTVS